MPAGATCHAIRWDLTLGTAEDANRWRLTAVYGIPPATNPGAMIDGPRVTKQGTLTSSTVRRLGAASTVFRLTGNAGSSIAFAQLGNDLVNLAGDDGSLVPGTSGWSYTLTRADRVEPPGVEIARASEGSYTVSPKETGSQVLRGAPGFPEASVYQLDAEASHGPILLLRADDNLVLFLNQQRQPLPGTADFSYTLTRSDH